MESFPGSPGQTWVCGASGRPELDSTNWWLAWIAFCMGAHVLRIDWREIPGLLPRRMEVT